MAAGCRRRPRGPVSTDRAGTASTTCGTDAHGGRRPDGRLGGGPRHAVDVLPSSHRPMSVQIMSVSRVVSICGLLCCIARSTAVAQSLRRAEHEQRAAAEYGPCRCANPRRPCFRAGLRGPAEAGLGRTFPEHTRRTVDAQSPARSARRFAPITTGHPKMRLCRRCQRRYSAARVSLREERPAVVRCQSQPREGLTGDRERTVW